MLDLIKTKTRRYWKINNMKTKYSTDQDDDSLLKTVEGVFTNDQAFVIVMNSLAISEHLVISRLGHFN